MTIICLLAFLCSLLHLQICCFIQDGRKQKPYGSQNILGFQQFPILLEARQQVRPSFMDNAVVPLVSFHVAVASKTCLSSFLKVFLQRGRTTAT